MMLVSVMSPETVVMSSWPMKAALLCTSMLFSIHDALTTIDALGWMQSVPA